MKKLLIIYNVIFLFAGNILLSNIHHLHHHHHNNHVHDYEMSECQECIIIMHNNNFIQESHEIKVLNSNTYLFINEYYSIVEFDFEQSYLSRAPPIS